MYSAFLVNTNHDTNHDDKTFETGGMALFIKT